MEPLVNLLNEQELPQYNSDGSFRNMMANLSFYNSVFLDHLIAALAFDRNPITAFPSIVFVISSMFIVYKVTHRHTLIRGHTWKHTMYRELVFQWGFFYLTRLWLWFMKGIKWVSGVFENYADAQYSKDGPVVSPVFIHTLFFIFYTLIAFAPAFMYANYKAHALEMPNFMIWVGVQRRERTEIGLAGYYLDRPLRNLPPVVQAATAYRARRSCSVDHAPPLRFRHTAEVTALRPVRSVEQLKPISSIEEIVS